MKVEENKMNGSVMPVGRDDEFNIGYGDNITTAASEIIPSTIKPNMKLQNEE